MPHQPSRDASNSLAAGNIRDVSDDRRGSARDHVRWFFTNWREYDAPLSTKLALTMRNRVRAFGHGCCGNHGQPGC
jgi:hypothetical protein